MYLGLWVIYTREHGFFYLGHWCGAMNLDQGFNVWPIHWPWTRAYQGLSHGVQGGHLGWTRDHYNAGGTG